MAALCICFPIWIAAQTLRWEDGSRQAFGLELHKPNFNHGDLTSQSNGADFNPRDLDNTQTAPAEDLLVNDDTTGGTIQYSPAVAMDAAGNFVVAWQDYRNGSDDIYFQRYNAAGIAQSPNQKANDDVGKESQEYASVAMDNSGNCVVVWTDYRNGDCDIYFQRYDALGAALGSNQKANDDAESAFQSDPSVAMDSLGNYVIVWIDNRKGSVNIYFQRYNRYGVAQGMNQWANDNTGVTSQSCPVVAMEGNGNFVVAWVDNNDIYFQRYNASGVAQGANRKANDDAGRASQSWPVIAMDGAGNFVIAWEDARNGHIDIFFQLYSVSGALKGNNKEAVHDLDINSHKTLGLAMHPTGNFLMFWMEFPLNRNYGNIIFQRRNASGVAIGPSQIINDDVSYNTPVVAMDNTGNFVIAWTDDRNGNSDIYFHRYRLTGTSQGTSQRANDDEGSTHQKYPSIGVDKTGNFIIAWIDKRNRYGDVFFQRYNAPCAAQGSNKRANENEIMDSIGPDYKPAVAMDVFGNYIIAWRGFPYDIYFQRYLALGAATGANQKADDSEGKAYGNQPIIAMNNAGNFLAVWEDARDDKTYGVRTNLYFQRYDPSGNAQGLNTLVDAPSINSENPSAAMDHSGNFVISWVMNSHSIFLQLYSSSGTIKRSYQKVNDNYGFARYSSPTVSMDDSGNFVVVWADSRNGNADTYFQCYDIYFQRYNAFGVAQGINQRVNDCIGTASQTGLAVAMDNDGNFVIAWTDYRFTHAPDVVAQRYNTDGTKRRNNFLVTADGPNHGEQNPCVAANADRIVFAWEDNRRSKGWDIYAKVVPWDWEGTTHVEDGRLSGPSSMELCQNYPNPFNPQTTVRWSLPRNGRVKIQVFDTMGREVTTLVDAERPAGPNQCVFDGSGLPGGLYFYRLLFGEHQTVRKMVLAK